MDPSSSKVFSSGSRVSRWLFAPTDPTAIAVFRVLLSVMLLIVFWPRGLALDRPFRGITGLVELYESVFLTRPYWYLALSAILVFATGWRSKLIGWGLATLLFPLLFLTAFRQSRQALLSVLVVFSLLGSHGPMWPVRLMQLQLSVIYGVNAIAKTTPEYFSGEVLMRMAVIAEFPRRSLRRLSASGPSADARQVSRPAHRGHRIWARAGVLVQTHASCDRGGGGGVPPDPSEDCQNRDARLDLDVPVPGVLPPIPVPAKAAHHALNSARNACQAGSSVLQSSRRPRQLQ